MIRNLVAAIVGIFVAMLTIRIVEMLGHFIYPPPANFEFGDPDQVREFIATLPVGSILFVAAAWAAGTFLGTLAGALLSTTGPLPYAVVVGGIVLAGAATMLVLIPHPYWFTALAPIAVIIAAFLAVQVARRLQPARSAGE